MLPISLPASRVIHAATLAAALGAVAHAQGPPVATLHPGEFYFRIGDRQTFLLGKNPTGWQVAQFEPLLDWAQGSGERIVRVQLTTGFGMGVARGEIDEQWAAKWESVFDLAEEREILVLPVFGVWADWNDGSGDEPWHAWHKNPYGPELGGPAASPTELLRDTECRRQWLNWLARLVERWSPRTNILGWEVFSEPNLVTGATDAPAVEFVARAAEVIRQADPHQRPITASLAGARAWRGGSSMMDGVAEIVDILQVHPYHADLDARIIRAVRALRSRYEKPVMIGECGLSAAPPGNPLTTAPRAHIGIKHAIWAAMVSGAMNGRMLWWEDGYDQYDRLDIRTAYKNASVPVARSVEGIDFADMAPLEVEASEGLFGAALGHEHAVLAWFRDADCVAPEWPVKQIDRAELRVRVLGPAETWTAEFIDTRTGDVSTVKTVSRDDDWLTVALPPFEDDIAVRLTTD
ncbi:MAG TPA: hypothetical protein QGH10_10240 [Armatimonadota bacterium]|nr:hypothetical protein [Armatimonadota bacterium]